MYTQQLDSATIELLRVLQAREPILVTIALYCDCMVYRLMTLSLLLCALQARDPIPQLRKYILSSGLATEADLKEIDQRVAEEVEDSVRFADESPKPEKGQLLENVFADPRGFGIAPNGQYRWEQGNNYCCFNSISVINKNTSINNLRSKSAHKPDCMCGHVLYQAPALRACMCSCMLGGSVPSWLAVPVTLATVGVVDYH